MGDPPSASSTGMAAVEAPQQTRDGPSPPPPPSPPAPPVPRRPKKLNGCDCFLVRKQRYCTVPRLPTSNYCGNHQMLEPGYEDKKVPTSNAAAQRGSRRRVPCPLDPLHTVYERDLPRHLRVCNVAKDKKSLAHTPFYRPGINSGPSACNEEPVVVQSPWEAHELHALFAKIRRLAEETGTHVCGDQVEQLTTDPVAAPIMASIQANGWTSEANKGRHVTQQASLVAHLHRRGLLHDRSICIEMGAGRGTLGQAVHLAFPLARVVLVERQGVRGKADSHHRRTGEGSHFERHRLDIRDLWVKGLPLPAAAPGDPPLVFMGKHVCGVATDLSLRAIAAYVREEGARPVAVAIATCCYHVCRYYDYVGRETWEQELGLTRRDFEVAHRSACWVSSLIGARGHRHKPRGRPGEPGSNHEKEEEQEEKGEGEEEEQDAEAADAAPAQPYGEDDGEQGGDDFVSSHGKGLSKERKIAQGWACKRLIDYGRLQYLRACGLAAECALYCEPDVSPENSCILAWSLPSLPA